MNHSSRFLFRRDIPLDATSRCTLYITAGARYDLFVNGTRVASGPPPGQPYWKFYDEIPLERVLRPGVNCLAVIVQASTDEPCGLMAELVDAGGQILLQTDDHWRVTDQHGWRTDPGPHIPRRQEYFDARLHPDGWDTPEFDDSAWARPDTRRMEPGSKKPFPWTRLVPHGLPPLKETIVRPRSVTAIEEGQDVLSRGREESLSVQLSAAGQPITHTLAEDVETLLAAQASAQFRCSVDHLHDRAFDGIWCPTVVLDFGRVVSGVFELDLQGPAGAVVQIGYVERLLNGHFNNAVEVFYADQYTLRDGRQVFRCGIWKSFRFVKLRILNCVEPVTVHGARAVACDYPFEDRGAFESDDPVLTGVFDISRRTLRLCARNYLMDSPWREKSQWTGDISAVTMGGLYACFGDTLLAGKFLRQAMENQGPQGLMANTLHNFAGPGIAAENYYARVIPDYSLWWIGALWQHYLYTGEEAYVHAGYPAVTRVLQFHFDYLNRRGLVENIPGWVFIDHVYRCVADEHTVYNALFYGMLRCALNMAEIKGDTWMQRKIETLRTTVATTFHARFFDPDTGVYCDGRTDGERNRTVSEHANMAAIFWGLCPPVSRESIIDRLYVKRDVDALEAEPFFSWVVLQALVSAGRTDLALGVIRERWGQRMLASGMTSTTEEWNASGSRRGPNHSYVGIFRSLSHAWSACPAEFLTRVLIGLDIVHPGCSRVRLAPCTDLDYRAVYAVPQGLIDVRVQNGRADVRLPAGVTVEEP
ncbi:MAG: family 78 glycoside hydrolase catalytic domain [Kiritimatiellia bacterium]